MVSRIPPPEEGSASRVGRSTGAVVLGLVLLVVLGLWQLNGGGPDTATSGGSGSGVTAIDPSTAPASAPSAPATDPDSGLPTVYLLDLPPEAGETVEVIDSGPPYPYDKDGSTFGNYEGLLPDYERGYYQEFTVETPRSSDRGARRIVEGADAELYWTDDHYQSFARILL